MENLKDLLEFFDEITFVSYFTVYPEAENIRPYLEAFNKKLLIRENIDFLVLGAKLNEIDTTDLPKKIKTFNSIESLVKYL